jgi:hypothetical protein
MITFCHQVIVVFALFTVSSFAILSKKIHSIVWEVQTQSSGNRIQTLKKLALV